MDKLNKLYPQILLSLFSLKAIVMPQVSIPDALIILFLAAIIVSKEFLTKKTEKDELLQQIDTLKNETTKKLENINSRLIELDEIKKHMGSLTAAGKIQSTMARF